MSTNRFTNLSTAAFKPLSFEEIMMVPMAKQKQHEDSQAAADEYLALQSKSLQGDREEVSAELQKMRAEADAISEQLNTQGVDPSIQRKLRALKRQKEKEFGQEGLIGNAAANYEAVQKYMKDMTTNEKMQAGWSPEEARVFAEHQVKQFGKTRNEDGTFNTFQGKNLIDKVDENEFLRKAVDDVANQVKPETLRYIKLNGLNDYTRAFREGTVDQVDYNTVMAHLANISRTTPELMNHLKQQAFFTGEKEYDDFGGIEETIKQDSNGKDYIHKQWVPGKSRFGMKMAGLGAVSSYRNTTESIRLIQDPLLYDMAKKGLDEKKALELLTFNDGELNQMTVKSFETLENTNKLYGEKRKELHEGVVKYKSQVADRIQLENPELKGRDLDDATNEALKNDREYKLLRQDYEDATINYNNTKLRIDSMSKKIEFKPSFSEQTYLDTDRLVNEKGGALKALMSLDFNEDELKSIESTLSKAGTSEEIIPFSELVKNIFNSDKEERTKDTAARDLLYKALFIKNNDGLGFGLGKSDAVSSNTNYLSASSSYNSKRQTKIDEYFKNNPKAGHFTILGGPDNGEYSTFTGAVSKQLSKDFKSSAINTKQLAYGKGLLMDSPEVIELGESEKGFDYKVTPTDGYDDNGDHFNNVVITNLSNNKMASVQVIDNRNNSILSGIADEYARGTYEQQQIATQIKAKMEFMKKIKTSGSIYQDEKFTIKLGNDLHHKDTGESVAIDFVKKGSTVTDRYRWIPSIKGKPIQGAKPLYSETEVAVYLYELSNSKRNPNN